MSDRPEKESMMELKNIRTFLYVAEQCSFSKAAAILGYSQSTITTQIQQLEQEFDTLLFERIHKTVRLTDAGQEFLLYAQEIVRTSENAKNAIKKLPVEAGKLRLAMAESICNTFFPSILEEFHERFPHVELELVTAGTDDMFSMLNHNEADLVYTLDHRIYSSELVTAFEKEEEICFVCSPNHPAAHQKLTLETLVAQNFLLTEKHMSYRKHLDEYLAAHSLEIHPFLEFGTVTMLAELVKKGIGVSFLPEFSVRSAIADGSLCKLHIPDRTFTVWRQLIYHKNKFFSPQMKALIQLILEHETA